MKYDFTQFPNLLQHTYQVDAEMELAQFRPLIQVQCSLDLEAFLCAVYMPPCTGQPSPQGQFVLRSLIYNVTTKQVHHYKRSPLNKFT